MQIYFFKSQSSSECAYFSKPPKTLPQLTLNTWSTILQTKQTLEADCYSSISVQLYSAKSQHKSSEESLKC